MPNKAFTQAKLNKKDEFYTQLYDIELELKHYKNYFKDKIVYCNCDDPDWSNFYFFFQEHFNDYGLKKLITTHFEYDKNKNSYKLEIFRDKNGKKSEPFPIKTPLNGNGDFRSQECIELLKESDIVVTNPPFSLFREYVNQLIEYDKKFLIIGNVNATSYTNIFKLIKDNKIWLGITIHSGDREFRVPDDYPTTASGWRINEEGKKIIKVKGVRWFTNLEHKQRHEELVLYEKYTPEKFPKYINYNAINVDKTVEIPKDYNGEIGVPITFLDKYNPDQFEIIGINSCGNNYFPKEKKLKILKSGKQTNSYINTNSCLFIPIKNPNKKICYVDENNNYLQSLYARIIIKNKKVGV